MATITEPVAILQGSFYCGTIGSLNLFSMEPTFRYREILKFRGLNKQLVKYVF